MVPLCDEQVEKLTVWKSKDRFHHELDKSH